MKNTEKLKKNWMKITLNWLCTHSNTQIYRHATLKWRSYSNEICFVLLLLFSSFFFYTFLYTLFLMFHVALTFLWLWSFKPVAFVIAHNKMLLPNILNAILIVCVYCSVVDVKCIGCSTIIFCFHSSFLYFFFFVPYMFLFFHFIFSFLFSFIYARAQSFYLKNYHHYTLQAQFM